MQTPPSPQKWSIFKNFMKDVKSNVLQPGYKNKQDGYDKIKYFGIFQSFEITVKIDNQKSTSPTHKQLYDRS